MHSSEADAAAHAGLAQVLDQGNILDRIAFEGRFGKVSADSKVVGPIDEVIGEGHVVPPPQSFPAVGGSLEPAAQVHACGIGVFDRDVLDGDVMVDIPEHAPRRADPVVEPVLDLDIVDGHISRGAPVAEHDPPVPESLGFLLDDRTLDACRRSACRV